MHLARWSRALFVGLAALASANASAVDASARSLQRRHEDEHPAADAHSSAHAAPLLELNETEILRWHAPDPLSYWDHDFHPGDVTDTNVRGLMTLHVLGMSFAFFVLLPFGIAMRSVKHTWHGPVALLFVVFALLSAATGSLYRKTTGDMYQGSIHGRHGYVVLALLSILALSDAFALLRRAVAFLRGPDWKNIRLFWRTVVLNQEFCATTNEYVHLVHDEPEEYVEAKLAPQDKEEDAPKTSRRTGRVPSPIDTSHGPTSEWVNQHEHEWPQSAASHRTLVNHNAYNPRHSVASDDTLHTATFSRSESHDSNDTPQRRPWLSTARRVTVATAERVLVLLGFMQLLSGITVYTGICRQNYINGCMAHLIKGSIFWCYGLLSFGRYLGAWADLGWAWNRVPSRRPHGRFTPSAEMVESAVIFLYGITNTWMERFGAAPGSPFTTKQVQHISIAVMFWFAGLLGLALESKRVRRWLAAPAHSVLKSDEAVVQPPSYMGSFNPFPALVIGVTGVAMSAHHQTYLFQVQIHALWGFFLAGFAVLRFLTYFFLWLRPPHSVLPSRPPTEALASFCLASGGLVFILSTEQITFAAMRQGHDDVMFFFNFAVAVTSLAFCWLLSVMAFKGWVTSRAAARPHPSFTRRVIFDTDIRVA